MCGGTMQWIVQISGKDQAVLLLAFTIVGFLPLSVIGSKVSGRACCHPEPSLSRAPSKGRRVVPGQPRKPRQIAEPAPSSAEGAAPRNDTACRIASTSFRND